MKKDEITITNNNVIMYLRKMIEQILGQIFLFDSQPS